MPTVTLQRGDTLTELSARYRVSVQAIARANGIDDIDEVQAGQRLTIPDRFDAEAAPVRARRSAGTASPRATHAESTVRAGDRQFPSSADGTPIFRQGDPEWGRRRLGDAASIAASGCAMTAAAMAISKISGNVITPGELDRYLDRRNGYTGDAIEWDMAAAAAGLRASRPDWSLSSLNEALDAGRPVVVAVDYKRGSRGGANGTDHWVTITGRESDENGRDVYTANDPATGQQFNFFQARGGRLVSDYQAPNGRNYTTTGQQVQFS